MYESTVGLISYYIVVLVIKRSPPSVSFLGKRVTQGWIHCVIWLLPVCWETASLCWLFLSVRPPSLLHLLVPERVWLCSGFWSPHTCSASAISTPGPHQLQDLQHKNLVLLHPLQQLVVELSWWFSNRLSRTFYVLLSSGLWIISV